MEAALDKVLECKLEWSWTMGCGYDQVNKSYHYGIVGIRPGQEYPKPPYLPFECKTLGVSVKLQENDSKCYQILKFIFKVKISFIKRKDGN